MADMALITDKNFINQVIITITSLHLNSNKNNSYNIYILCNDVDSDAQKRLKDCAKDNIKIYTINAQNYIKNLPEFQNGNIHVNKTALIKFYLREILGNLDKILYLDSDILILRDLHELFNTDIENYYVGAVRDSFKIITKEYLLRHKIQNNIYFNSGIMLLNLKKMRDDNITEKLIDYRVKNHTFCMDQDAFNYVLGSNLRQLSYKYNLMPTTLKQKRFKDFCKFYDDYTIKHKSEVINKSYIIHFADPRKPWIYKKGEDSEMYKYYWEQALPEQEFPKLKKLREERTIMRKIALTFRLLGW